MLVARCEVRYTGRLTAFLPEDSRNLAVLPELAIVIFDSRQRPRTGEAAVYMSARAEQVS